MTRIIGIVGGAGAGKTTAAEYLRETRGARLYALADPLKVAVSEAFQIPLATFHGTQAQKLAVDGRYDLSPRELMQRVGDGIRASLGDDTLTQRTLELIRKEAPSLAVVTDVRRHNEASLLHREGATLWRLHYAPDVRRPVSEHPTETEWKTCHADLQLFPGAGGVEQLYTAVNMAFRKGEQLELDLTEPTSVPKTPEWPEWLVRMLKLWVDALAIDDALDPSKAVGDSLIKAARQGFPAVPKLCRTCHGTGERPADAVSRYGLKPNHFRECLECEGTGKREA